MNLIVPSWTGLTKTLLTMKITALFLLVGCMQVCARGYTQTVSLSEKNASLEKVLREIKRQTGYDFLFESGLAREAGKVDVQATNEPLETVLNQCFQNQPLIYSIVEKIIIIKKKEAADPEPLFQPPLIEVHGRVVDEKGAPLVGASIKVKDEKVGTTTDAGGVFSIKVPIHTVLIISIIGYQPKEITVEKEETIKIVLSPSNKSIDEVVVTGFGESRVKRSLGYSVTQISGDQIREANAVNPITALQGMVAGLQVQAGTTGPSASPRFLIRGSASLNPYDNTPLVVVDGVIMDDQSVLGSNATGANFGSVLKDLNPDDIESLSVLKGGAVTALYGSRAANGVILIKTKRGYKSKGIGVSFAHSDYVDHPYKTVSYENQFGSGGWTSDWDTVNNVLQIDPNTYGLNFGPPIAGQKYYDPYSGDTTINRANNPLSLFRNALTDNTNIALNAATDNSTFRLSYSNLSANGTSPNNELKRNSFQLHATTNLANKVSVDANATYVQTGTWNPSLINDPGGSPLYQFAYGMPRNLNISYWVNHFIDPVNGGINTKDYSGVTNILFPLYEDNVYQIENNFRGSIQTAAHILPWMDFQSTISTNIYSRNESNDVRGTQPGFSGASFSTYASLLNQFRYNASLAFKKQLSKELNGTLQAGGEIFTSTSTGNTASTNGTILPDVYTLANSQQLPSVSQLAPNASQINSVFFQGSFAYKNNYFLNYYGRNDWNSSLVYNDGHGTYSYFYPGVDLSWVFTDAIPHLSKIFNYGKIRFSYDLSGNGTDPYTANTGAYTTSGPYTLPASGGSGTVNPFGYTSQTLPNQHLVPEKDSKFETGLELKALNNRVGADITFYTQDSKDQIISFPVPQYSGVNAALLNGGVIRNMGTEIVLTGTPVRTRNFAWNTQINYTLNRNKVIELPLGTTYQQLEGGGSFGTIAVKGGDYGLLAGQFAYARYQATNAAGDNIASPLNGQHVLNSVDPTGTFTQYVRAVNYGTTPTTQQPIVGSTLPKFLGSWQNSFTYKRFTLTIFLDSRFGGLENSSTLQFGSQLGSLKSTLPGRTTALGGVAYTPLPNTATYGFSNVNGSPRNDGILPKGVFAQGTQTEGQDQALHNVGGMTFAQAYKQGLVQPVDAPDYYYNQFSFFQGITEAADFKNDWVVVRDISVSYDLPPNWASKVKMNNLRMIISVRNPFYLYNAAVDKVNPDNLNDTGSGAYSDAEGSPYLRTFGFSVNGSF